MKSRILGIFFIISLLSIVSIFLKLIVQSDLLFQFYPIFFKSLDHLLNNFSRFLFYLGCFFLSVFFIYLKRYFAAFIIISIGVLWLSFYDSTFGYIRNLGSDSFYELKSFEISEALFWLETSFDHIGVNLDSRILLLYSFLAFVILFGYLLLAFILNISSYSRNRFGHYMGIILIVFSIFINTFQAVFLFYSNSESFNQISSNFLNTSPPLVKENSPNVFMYIGESTSTMNMGIYGYPRNTTPRLSAIEISEKGFIKFNKVLSTHTHTSQSLLEALSLDKNNEKNKIIPISQRERISVIDIIKEANIDVNLYSNQGSTGTWNQASSIVFKNANKIFSTTNFNLGNSDALITKPLDKEFLEQNISSSLLDASSSFVVLHSYAGHGPYLKNIPLDFANGYKDAYSSLTPRAIGGNINSAAMVNDYDDAIRYIDSAIASAISITKNSKEPWVFVYTADHGDAVFANRAHDSARFLHEMIRVPFIIYFNEEAQKKYPDLFKKYINLAKDENLTTLASLSYTLLDLLGIKLLNFETNSRIIGSKRYLPPIVVRDTSEGVSAIRLTQTPLPKDIIDSTDLTTSHLILNENRKTDDPSICYHKSNSIAKFLRGFLVTDCVELDITIDDKNDLAIKRKSDQYTGLILEDLIPRLNDDRNYKIWLDIKNLNNPKACKIVYEKLNKLDLKGVDIFLEFPSYSYKELNSLNCFDDFKKLNNLIASYYVPSDILIKCALSLQNKFFLSKSTSCMKLKQELNNVKETNFFNDISFDYSGLLAIKSLEISSSFRWSMWHVPPNQYINLKKTNENFRNLVILNKDPNNL